MTSVSLQFLPAFLDLYDLLKISEKGLFTSHNEPSSSTSCLSTPECLPSGAVDCSESKFLKITLT